MDPFKHKMFMFAVLICFIIDCNCSEKTNDEPFDVYNNCIKSIATLFEIKITRSKNETYCPDDLKELSTETCAKSAIKNLKDVRTQDINDKNDLRQRLKTVITKNKQSVEKVIKKLERTKYRLSKNKEETQSQKSDNTEETESQESDDTKETEFQESDKKDLSYGEEYYKLLGSYLDPNSILDPIKFCESHEKKRVSISVNPFSKKDCTYQLKEFIKSTEGALNYALYNVVLKDFERTHGKPENFQLQYMKEIIANVKVRSLDEDYQPRINPSPGEHDENITEFDENITDDDEEQFNKSTDDDEEQFNKSIDDDVKQFNKSKGLGLDYQIPINLSPEEIDEYIKNTSKKFDENITDDEEVQFNKSLDYSEEQLKCINDIGIYFKLISHNRECNHLTDDELATFTKKRCLYNAIHSLRCDNNLTGYGKQYFDDLGNNIEESIDLNDKKRFCEGGIDLELKKRFCKPDEREPKVKCFPFKKRNKECLKQLEKFPQNIKRLLKYAFNEVVMADFNDYGQFHKGNFGRLYMEHILKEGNVLIKYKFQNPPEYCQHLIPSIEDD